MDVFMTSRGTRRDDPSVTENDDEPRLLPYAGSMDVHSELPPLSSSSSPPPRPAPSAGGSLAPHYVMEIAFLHNAYRADVW